MAAALETDPLFRQRIEKGFRETEPELTGALDSGSPPAGRGPARRGGRGLRAPPAGLGRRQKLLNSLTAAEKAQLADEQNRATRAASATPSRSNVPAGSGRAAAAFAAAQSKLGTPYVYGATGPSSFDCSGLTSWAYAQAGTASRAPPRLDRRRHQDLLGGPAQGRRPGVLLQRPAPRRPLRGQRPDHPRPRTGTVVRYESMNTIGGPFMFGVRV
ncbi:NlpC/P60 domain-containing protein OS=Streptomyces tendae OX=1932 GN=F3L20_24255 PE=3 SV=1 [Streptomyces tendae]